MTNNKKRCDNPNFTVITIVFNGDKHIEETINSVISQKNTSFEYIIIDGGSTDNTLKIINKYSKSIDLLISESDNGISDAFNKGILNAKGKLVMLINSDDYLSDEYTLEKIFKYHSQSNPKIISGRLKILNSKRPDRIWVPSTANLGWEMSIPHPATIVPNIFYKNYGLFNCEYKVAMDYEIIKRFISNGVTIEVIPEVIAVMRAGGVSSVNYRLGLHEIRKVVLFYDGLPQLIRCFYHHLLRVLQSEAMRLLDKVKLGYLISNYFKRDYYNNK